MSHEPTTEEALTRALELVRQHLAKGDHGKAEYDLDRARVLIEVLSDNLALSRELGDDTKQETARLAQHRANYKVLKTAMRTGRSNPGGPETPDLKKAVAGYEVFHKFTPREIGTLRGLKIPTHVMIVGEALQTLYRSDKWENKSHDYFHDHEGGVKLGRTDVQKFGGAVRTKLPGYITDISAVYLLGKCLGFSYRDLAGETIEAQVSPPLPELYAVPNRKALLVIETSGNVAVVKAVMWGGGLEVRDVGIVG